jgi:hypothetical protein
MCSILLFGESVPIFVMVLLARDPFQKKKYQAKETAMEKV